MTTTEIADEVRVLAREMTTSINSCIEAGEAQGKLFYLNEEAILEFLHHVYELGRKAAQNDS